MCISGRNYTNRRTTPVNGVPIEIGTINLPLANPYDFWYVTGRVDHRLTDRDNLTYRLQVDKRNQPDLISNLQFSDLFSGAQTILGKIMRLARLGPSGRVSSMNSASGSSAAYWISPKTIHDTEHAITGLFTIADSPTSHKAGRRTRFSGKMFPPTWRPPFPEVRGGPEAVQAIQPGAFDVKGTYNFDNLQDFINNRAASFRQP